MPRNDGKLHDGQQSRCLHPSNVQLSVRIDSTMHTHTHTHTYIQTSIHRDPFIQCFDAVGWATGRASTMVKNWVLVCWWWHFDWSFALLTTTSITLSSNKIHNGHILVRVNRGPPGKWPLTRRGRPKAAEGGLGWGQNHRGLGAGVPQRVQGRSSVRGSAWRSPQKLKNF